MNTLTRSLAAAAAALAVMALTVTATFAGNWADATVTPADTEPPTAGQESELVITLMQHGITPVDFGTVTLTALNTATGERVERRASSRGDGEWVVDVSFPVDGSWDLTVAHSDLEVGAVAPIQIAAAPATGSPSVGPTGLVVGAVALAALLAAGSVWLARRSRVGPRHGPRALADRSEA